MNARRRVVISVSVTDNYEEPNEITYSTITSANERWKMGSDIPMTLNAEDVEKIRIALSLIAVSIGVGEYSTYGIKHWLDQADNWIKAAE